MNNNTYTRARHNHTAYCYPHKHTEIVTPTPYWTFLSPWTEHHATLWDHFKQVLKFPNTLGPQSRMLWAPFSPLPNDVLALSPFRGRIVSPHPVYVPTQGCIPGPHTRALQRHCLQGCRSGVPPASLTQQRHGKKKEGKWLKIVPEHVCQDKSFYVRSKGHGHRKCSFWGANTRGFHTLSDIGLYLHCSESTSSHTLAFLRTGT